MQITKAVEAEVARRLHEHEKQRALEEEQRRAEIVARRQSKPTSPRKELIVPAGLLTPLLKRHRDLDDELQRRIRDLETKLFGCFSHVFDANVFIDFHAQGSGPQRGPTRRSFIPTVTKAHRESICRSSSGSFRKVRYLHIY